MQTSNSVQAIQSRILIIDDHRVVAQALSSLIQVHERDAKVEITSDLTGVRDIVNSFRPNVIVCDLEMPGGDPLDVIADIRTIEPKIAILILTAFPTDAHIARALKLKVNGFMTKHEPAETVLDGIRAILTGHAIYSDEVRDRITESGSGSNIELKVLTLSPRELTVVRLVAQGLTTAQIAEMIHRSPKTIDNQISSALTKTQSNNRVELSRWAIREGLIEA
jgi:DNA-binding NarL/FixJ family response regulator